MKQFNFNPQTLLHQEFTSAAKGYDADEVDDVIDKIIEDYLLFKAVLEKMDQEKKQHIEEIANLKIELQKGQIKLRESQKIPKVNNDNFDLIKKISFLEQKCHNLEQQLKEK